MATFKFSGDYDKVSAELKKTLEAQEARFNSSLQALFKSESPSMTPRVRAMPAQPSAGSAQNAGRTPAPNGRPVEKPAARTAAPHSPTGQSSGSMLSNSSKNGDNDTARGRLRNSFRTR